MWKCGQCQNKGAFLYYRYRYFTHDIDASYRHTLYRYISIHIDESLYPYCIHVCHGIMMQSGDSQEAFILCSVKTRVPLYTLPKGKNMTSSLCPLMSALLIQISIHAGNHMIIIVGWVDTLNGYIHIDYIQIIYILIRKTLPHYPLWDLLSLTFTCLYPECSFIIQFNQFSLPSD